MSGCSRADRSGSIGRDGRNRRARRCHASDGRLRGQPRQTRRAWPCDRRRHQRHHHGHPPSRTVAGTLSDLFGWRSVYLVSAGATLVVDELLFRSLPRQNQPRARVSYARLILSVFTLFAEEPMLRIRAMLALFIFFAITVLLTPLVLLLDTHS